MDNKHWDLSDYPDEQQADSNPLEHVVMCKCANCRKEIAQATAKVCMHAQMHRYVCDTKCMNEFYT